MSALDKKLPDIFADAKDVSPLDILRSATVHVNDDSLERLDPEDRKNYPQLRSIIVSQGRINVSLTLSSINVITWLLLLLTAGVDLLYVLQVSWLDNHTVRIFHLITCIALFAAFILMISSRNKVDKVISSYLRLEGAARSGPTPLQVSDGAPETGQSDLGLSDEDIRLLLDRYEAAVKRGTVTRDQEQFLLDVQGNEEKVRELDRRRVEKAWTNHKLRTKPGFDGHRRNLKI